LFLLASNIVFKNFEDFTLILEFIMKFNILFPLSAFEAQMLTTMNVAPNQLYLNSWTFLKALQIVYHYLNICPIINNFYVFLSI